MKTDSLYVDKSKIHKKGVFALRNFKKGEVVLKWDCSKEITLREFKKKSEKDKKHFVCFKEKCFLTQDPEKYINHSCEPNTFVKNFCDIAKRNIKKGEEITTDYNKEDYFYKKIKCNCKTQNCKKIIKI